MIDSHCHLDFPIFDVDRSEVMARAVSQGIQRFVVPGVARLQWTRLLELAKHYPQWYLAFGLHPYFTQEHVPADLMHLHEHLKAHPTALVGEIGLDVTCENWPLQQLLFQGQLDLASAFHRPIILHHRKSQDIMYPLVKNAVSRGCPGGVLHAFSGSYEQAMRWHALGFALGIGGTITYERARKTRDAVARVPLSALVLETDSPDMPVAGHQGERNEPVHVKQVLEALLALRPEAADQVIQQITCNTRRLLRC
ncbi:MAG: TatD family hydrolase [Idiomarina sp.]|nr:TatD family hydrolase [Idiomarina sp.]